jgi:excisionase family DNA binding protein
MDIFYTPAEVANMLKTTRRSVYRWIKAGKLKSVKAGKYVRIARDDLEAFLGRSIPRDD